MQLLLKYLNRTQDQQDLGATWGLEDQALSAGAGMLRWGGHWGNLLLSENTRYISVRLLWSLPAQSCGATSKEAASANKWRPR